MHINTYNPDHQSCNGQPGVAKDHRRPQPTVAATAIAPVVLDQPDGEHVQAQPCGQEPGDQCSNSHDLFSSGDSLPAAADRWAAWVQPTRTGGIPAITRFMLPGYSG